MLVRLLQARFPVVPEQTLDIVNQTQAIDQLDRWFSQSLMAQSFDVLFFEHEI